MRTVVELLRPRLWPRVLALALMAGGVAACSSDSMRFSDDQFGGNPAQQGRNPNEVTGSVAAAPAGRVERGPLPNTAQHYPPGSGTSGGGRGMASYNPGSAPPPQPREGAPRPAPAPEITGSVPAPRPVPSGHWSWDGGTPVTVAPGDTVETLARRYGVPASAIVATNNLAPPATLQPGQPLVIPRYVQAPAANNYAPAPPAGASAPVAAPRAAVPAVASTAARSQVPANSGVHVVAPGETLSKISRLYGKPVGELARVNRLEPGARLRVGDRIVIPGVRTSKAAPKPAPSVVQAKAPAPPPAANKEPADESVSMVAPAPDADAPPAKSAEATGALPTFRWPARGRVIAGYGPTPNGTQNDGINIALPEGTPVKAAEDGTVAYAGNELKGYGNLLLIRHPNGYVTAYAHTKELMVKRGETIKRGQVIAKSGMTGNVNAPQLHFEVRKGATPLDPIRYLNGG